MKRSERADVARDTLAIVERGTYATADGLTHDIAIPTRECLTRTAFYPPEALLALRDEVRTRPDLGADARIEVVAETTLEGVARLLPFGPVAVLNFASARNPGGGFLGGSQAQEESLARSSALYPSQLRAPEFYARHRAAESLLYSDAMIVSPDCPIIRDDAGALVPAPRLATFLTCAAPNAGAIAETRPHELPLIAETLARRAELVLALAASLGRRQLVLGAWGCGVFRNDPERVAAAFATPLRAGWARHFERVSFSVYDPTPRRQTLAAFERALSVE